VPEGDNDFLVFKDNPMTNILIVDDSPIDRRLVGELLSQNPGAALQYAVSGAEAVENMPVGELAAGGPCLQIEYAEDGRDALAKLARRPADLVVTDLLMPEINGLQLVAAMREKYPRIPVILMTSQGSEEIAVQALQQGAASYVPKKLLLRYLWETVAKVLKAAVEDRGQARLLQCMLRTESTFHLENDSALFDPLVRYLQEETIRLGVCAAADRVRVGIALEEALANALYHGNLEIASELRGTPGYGDLILQRRSQAPYQQRCIEVEARITRSEAAFTIRDEGSGFDPRALPDPTDPANIEKTSGRGIFLMRAFMDEVIYNDVGNAVALVKRRV
jgi:CheY-like chemotaxis protein/anti-sigma regulatory factor (Ser/Thr protein kinase)